MENIHSTGSDPYHRLVPTQDEYSSEEQNEECSSEGEGEENVSERSSLVSSQDYHGVDAIYKGSVGRSSRAASVQGMEEESSYEEEVSEEEVSEEEVSEEEVSEEEGFRQYSIFAGLKRLPPPKPLSFFEKDLSSEDLLLISKSDEHLPVFASFVNSLPSDHEANQFKAFAQAGLFGEPILQSQFENIKELICGGEDYAPTTFRDFYNRFWELCKNMDQTIESLEKTGADKKTQKELIDKRTLLSRFINIDANLNLFLLWNGKLSSDDVDYLLQNRNINLYLIGFLLKRVFPELKLELKVLDRLIQYDRMLSVGSQSAIRSLYSEKKQPENVQQFGRALSGASPYDYSQAALWSQHVKNYENLDPHFYLFQVIVQNIKNQKLLPQTILTTAIKSGCKSKFLRHLVERVGVEVADEDLFAAVAPLNEYQLRYSLTHSGPTYLPEQTYGRDDFTSERVEVINLISQYRPLEDAHIKILAKGSPKKNMNEIKQMGENLLRALDQIRDPKVQKLISQNPENAINLLTGAEKFESSKSSSEIVVLNAEEKGQLIKNVGDAISALNKTNTLFYVAPESMTLTDARGNLNFSGIGASITDAAEKAVRSERTGDIHKDVINLLVPKANIATLDTIKELLKSGKVDPDTMIEIIESYLCQGEGEHKISLPEDFLITAFELSAHNTVMLYLKNNLKLQFWQQSGKEMKPIRKIDAELNMLHCRDLKYGKEIIGMILQQSSIAINDSLIAYLSVNNDANKLHLLRYVLSNAKTLTPSTLKILLRFHRDKYYQTYKKERSYEKVNIDYFQDVTFRATLFDVFTDEERKLIKVTSSMTPLDKADLVETAIQKPDFLLPVEDMKMVMKAVEPQGVPQEILPLLFMAYGNKAEEIVTSCPSAFLAAQRDPAAYEVASKFGASKEFLNKYLPHGIPQRVKTPSKKSPPGIQKVEYLEGEEWDDLAIKWGKQEEEVGLAGLNNIPVKEGKQAEKNPRTAPIKGVVSRGVIAEQKTRELKTALEKDFALDTIMFICEKGAIVTEEIVNLALQKNVSQDVVDFLLNICE